MRKYERRHIIAEALFDEIDKIWIVSIEGIEGTDTCYDKRTVGKTAVSFAASQLNCSPSLVILDRVIYQ